MRPPHCSRGSRGPVGAAAGSGARATVGASTGTAGATDGLSVVAAVAPPASGCGADKLVRRCGVGASAPLGSALVVTETAAPGDGRPPELLRPPTAVVPPVVPVVPAADWPATTVPAAPAVSDRGRADARLDVVVPTAPVATGATLRAASPGVTAPDAAGIGATMAAIAALAAGTASSVGAEATSLTTGALGGIVARAGAGADAACGTTAGPGAGRWLHQ